MHSVIEARLLTESEYFMSEESRLQLTQIFEEQHGDNAPRLQPDKYFEVFAAEQVLKSRNYDLDSDQVKSGIVGNGGDGGVDSIYLFVNNKLIRIDTDISTFKGQQLTIDLVVVQSKNENSFRESVIKNFEDFANNCLKLSADLSKVSRTLYKQALVDVVERFHTIYRDALSYRPSLAITFYYASFGEKVDTKVSTRKDLFKERLGEFFSKATIDCHLAGAKHLLDWYYIAPLKVIPLMASRSLPWRRGGNSFVSLVPIRNFYDFITDGNKLRERIFESNVRDYQGDVKVNKEIGATLQTTTDEDFWWLNNGITIVASDVTGPGDTLHLTDPLIVNGLQTSYEIFLRYRDGEPLFPDDRTILVRVIETKDIDSVNRIIKATNSQTKIPPVWLHATEDIHRKIEIALKRVGLYYDRRKNHYRNLGKATREIVTIPYLSQALVAIVLQRPDDARARPTTAAERHYRYLYDDSYPKDIYAKCALVLKRLDEYMDGLDIERGDRLNMIFYVAMYSTCAVLRSPKPRRSTIAGIDLDRFTDRLLEDCFNRVQEKYKALGGDDMVAKGTQLLSLLKADIQDRFGRKPSQVPLES